MKRFFIGVDPMAGKDNLDFALMTEKEIKAVELESDSVYDYLTNYPMESWFEIGISIENLHKLEKMVEIIKKEVWG